MLFNTQSLFYGIQNCLLGHGINTLLNVYSCFADDFIFSIGQTGFNIQNYDFDTQNIFLLDLEQ